MSSLAAQLAQSASLNSTLLVDRTRRKPTTSYLFTGREADQHDLESIHALGVNAFLQLSSIDHSLSKYESDLFSERAKGTDRTLLTEEQIEKLDEALEAFLLALGPYLMEALTGRILEWLVRRFRINEFNVEAVLSFFLPYHESPHFTKMMTILNIKSNSTWSFLLPYRSAAQKLPRVSLVTEMLRNSEVARFVASLLPAAVKKGVSHRVLVAFNAAALHEFMNRNKSLDEGTVAYLLPAILEPLEPKHKTISTDAILGSFVLLAALSQKAELSPAALRVIVSSMVKNAHLVRGDQMINSLVAVCKPQPELDKFTDGSLNSILKIPNVAEEVASALCWTGSEKLISPLVKSLSFRLFDDTSVAILEGVVGASVFHYDIVGVLADVLLKTAINPQAVTQDALTARRLLSRVQQRFPNVLQKVGDNLCEADDAVREAVEQLTISLSVREQISLNLSAHEGIDMILASANADGKVRTLAVKDLIKGIAGKDLSALEEVGTIQHSLLARLQDHDVHVLEALYEDPSTVTSLFTLDAEAFISALELAIATPTAKPKRNVLRIHLTYLTSHFWIKMDSAHQEAIFHRILFPFLLFSKSRQKTAEVVWDIIHCHVPEIPGSHITDWIAGCSSLTKASLGGSGEPIDLMSVINAKNSEKIAENILASNNVHAHLETLLAKLKDSNSHTKLLGYLVALSLVKKLVGEHQIEAAYKIIQVMDIEAFVGVEDLPENADANAPDAFAIWKSIVTKPGSRSSLHWLQISIVKAITEITRPANLTLNWLMGTTADAKDRSSRYIQLMRKAYYLANASTTLPVLTTNLLQSLFISLKDDALAFLAGIWVVGTSDALNPVKAIALLHAAAFLEAHVSENDGVDFQTILPSLLVALQIPDSRVCQGALECISRIRILAERQLTSIYRFDTIYGESGKTLQYLDQDDLKRYLSALAEHRDHFTNDASHVKVFHEQHLNRSKADKKRELEYKHRVACFLLSHINSSSCEHVQVILLKSLATVVEKAKSLIMLPTIEALSRKAEAVQPLSIFTVASEELILHALSCFDDSSASYLNAKEDVWGIFLHVLRTFFRPGTPASVQEALSHALEGGLFSVLNHQRKLVICEVLLNIGAQEPSKSGPRNVLTNVLSEVPLMIQLLGSLSPVATGGSPRVSKRAKTTESPEDTVSRLTLLVEILGTKPLPGSLELITHLLDTLNKVIQSPPSSPNDVSYIEQLLMSAIESAASKITEVPNISPSVIRLEILVELIRVSGNPQTFHQALLLIANLARLAPESVLFNVMPIFTFMGSNVFHRDDTYSFKVVQQTIDGIVPVMAESLREAHSEPLGLYIGSREFLRVFTDAAHHIPRHRRNNFFMHLVNVLGTRDFLPPITMLLVEKNVNRIVRQPPDEAQHSLALPISLFQRSDFEQQKYAASQILEEVQRLLARIIDADPQPIFLEGTTEGDHSLSSSTLLKRRSQALVIFVGYALKGRTSTSTLLSCEEHAMSGIIAKLIILATFREGNTLDTKIEDVTHAALISMNRLLTHMSVIDFIQSVEAMIRSGDVKVEAGALELLAKRLPDISSKARQEISGTINKILGLIRDLLAIHKRDRVVAFAFQSVRAIADTMCPGEETSLTDLVPSALAAALSADSVEFALAALPVMLIKLGPRIIPFFRQIVSQAITVLRGDESGLFDNALTTLNALLSTIPTFWGSGEVSQLVHLYIDSSSKVTPSASLTKVIKSAAKRLPAKVLLPTLIDLWSSLEVSRDIGRISAYFEVLSRGLQHAERPIVLEHLRSTFNIFLVALDIVKTDEKAETRVITAFRELVVKLNEAAFKPLFRRLYDWAFAEEIADIARKVTFGHLYIALLEFFKGLVVPYMSFLLQPFNDILKSFTSSSTVDLALWSTIIQVLTHSLNYDDGAFWRDDKLRQLSSALTSQIEVCIRLNYAEGKPLLEECLSAFVENAMDDTLLKTINLNILMYTRSEDSRIRIFALTCSDALWRSHSNKLLGFVAETATFIAECGEDDNDIVVKESFRLKDAVESVAGKIDGL